MPQDFDTWFDTAFNLALGDLNLGSAVGKGPMSSYGTIVRDVLKYDGLAFDKDRVAMLRMVVLDKIRAMEAGTYKPDDINVFVKCEPHKDEKLKEGRYRLIMAVSLEDTMIDRMLYREFQIRNVLGNTPVKSGYNPLQGGYRRLAESFPGRSLSIDKKAWDFSVPRWMIELWSVFLEDLVHGAPDWWVTIHRARFAALYSPETTYVFPDKSRAAQLIYGIMKSGCYNTLFLNSVGQCIIYLLARLRCKIPLGLLWAVGDDTLEDVPDDVEGYVEQIKRMGFNIKQQLVLPYVEFCGFEMDERRVRPAYLQKHLFKALYEGGDQWIDKMRIYTMLYAFDPEVYDLLSEMLTYVDGRSKYPAELWRLVWRGVV